MSLPIEAEILNGLVFDREFARAAIPHLEDVYFTDDGMRTIVKLVKDYTVRYKGLPSLDAIAIDLQNVKDISQEQFDTAKGIITELKMPEVDFKWLIDRAEEFCQDRALYLGIMKAIEIVDGKDAKLGIAKGSIPDILQKALAVNFDRSIGHDYLNESGGRYDYYHDTENLIPFDLEMLNRITDGGLAPKTLTVLTAAPNAGKTLMMCHMAAANMTMGKKVVYFTMEMADKRIAQRIDANLLNIPISELKGLNREDFQTRISRLRDRTPGDIVIKEYPTGAGNSGHFKHTLTELEQKKGFKADIVYIDYMNICASSRYQSLNGVSSYTVVKSIAEELRGLAVEFNVPIVTATQLNRTGADSNDPSMTDTSDSFGTPMTADLQLAIMTSEELDEVGKVMIKQLKNRDHDVSRYRKFLLKIDRQKMQLSDDDDMRSELSMNDSYGSSSDTSASQHIKVPKNVFDLNFDNL